ncbi:MAG: FeS assembly system protein [Rhodocyclaceae bacterium]|nr:FeS assembly system protein [Rhodocyclaceae bacterium]
MDLRKWVGRDKSKAEGKAPDSARPGLESEVVAALRTVFDPEIPVNIYDLGLIYGLEANEATGAVRIRMTLTAPACPVAATFPAKVEEVVRQVAGVREALVELVWEPPWSMGMMSEAARLELGMY